MKRIKFEALEPGDIILTASATKIGKAIRASTGGDVSHAMICVQRGSVIDSTEAGVQAWNVQREVFQDHENVFVFRLREALPRHRIAELVDFARAEIGTRYSKAEAVRTVLGGPKPRSNRQFCSRLVARAYASIGVQLVADQDYCTPEDLRRSPLLIELTDVIETVSEDEIAWRDSQPDPTQRMMAAQNEVLGVARGLDPRVESLNDVITLVRERPDWDGIIAQAYRDSGYLELWKFELDRHPWRYDHRGIEALHNSSNQEQLRSYCVETIREAYSGGARFAVNLVQCVTLHRAGPRETLYLLIELYETLIRNHENRIEVARAWLMKNYPDDAKAHMERVEPHSDLWFSIVDRVEPMLGVLARASIQATESKEVCSSCGDDPARDYRIANSAEAMPGVPALRLCDDCLAIRQGFGERLELID